MADEPGGRPGGPDEQERKSAALRLAEEMQRRPFTAAAIGVGAAAATAGAVLGARALAKRASEGKPLNAVLKNAITANEAAAVCKQQDDESGGSGGGETPA